MFDGTPESEKLCREMAELCEGVCVLGFSGGKDGLAAWLYLRKFFDKIIPFHLDFIPGLQFVDRSLAYYEDYFETKIERYLIWEGLPQLLGIGAFQPKESLELLEKHPEFWYYNHHQVGWLISEKHGYEKAWNAFGFSLYDSLDRIGWVRKCQGKHDKYFAFYPCWNWKVSEILEYIKQHNVSLSEHYLVHNRTLCNVHDVSMLENIRDKFPEDFALIKSWFPLVEARIARNEFRKSKVPK